MENIVIKKETFWKYLTFFVVAGVVAFIFIYFAQKPSITGKAIDINPGSIEGDDAVEGNPEAKVVIVEFSEYECPFCGKFWSGTYQQIKKEYIDTGKVKWVFRDFPLEFHPNAQKAAEAAECVRSIGGDKAYYEMHDKMFANQNRLSVDNMKIWAKEMGYDIDKCLDSGKFKKEVQQDFEDGQRLGVSGTPTFFINGKKIVGAQPFEVFKKAIEEELNK